MKPIRAYQVVFSGYGWMDTFIDIEAPSAKQAAEVLKHNLRSETAGDCASDGNPITGILGANVSGDFEEIDPDDFEVQDVTDRSDDLEDVEWPPNFAGQD